MERLTAAKLVTPFPSRPASHTSFFLSPHLTVQLGVVKEKKVARAGGKAKQWKNKELHFLLGHVGGATGKERVVEQQSYLSPRAFDCITQLSDREIFSPLSRWFWSLIHPLPKCSLALLSDWNTNYLPLSLSRPLPWIGSHWGGNGNGKAYICIYIYMCCFAGEGRSKDFLHKLAFPLHNPSSLLFSLSNSSPPPHLSFHFLCTPFSFTSPNYLWS